MRYIQALLFVAAASGFAAFADLVVPGQDACNQVKITNATEVTKLMNMIPGKGKTTQEDDGGRKILILTKELNLGAGSLISCTVMTQDGRPVGYFRGSRPGCTIYGQNSRGSSGSSSQPSNAEQ